MGDSNLLFEQIFNKSLSEKDSTDFLINLTKEHPYFTIAQYYLLKQTSSVSDTYLNQAAKTAVLFNNPLWLNYQLNYIDDAQVAPTPLEVKKEIIETHNPILKLENNYTDAKVEAISSHSQNTVIQHPIINENETLLPLVFGEEKLNNLLIDENVEAIEHKLIIDEEVKINNDHEINNNFPLLNLGTDTKSTAKNDDDYNEEKEMMDGNEIEPMNIKFNFKQDMTTTEDTISFEPLHTSDYFASLGIKLNEEGKPVDKFGQQLKSFTEWLKTMKKIHADQLNESTEQTDIVIQKMAEKSNMQGDVLTEAMAEVFIQQGKVRKAADLYKKLSLLDPSKSAYFAAKIDQIKK